MDIPLPSDQANNGRTGLANTNWSFQIFPTAYLDITSGACTNGIPGVTIDNRAASQPPYTNNTASSPVSGADNTSLGAPNAETLFIAQRDPANAGRILNFIRLSVKDIAPDPADGIYRRGVWLQKIYTGEGCNNKNFRWFLCSPLYQDP